jgi:glycerate-2-kinase
MALHVALRLQQESAQHDLVFLSGGTDGQDGPTDAAGAVVDGQTLAAMARHLQPARDALERCDANTFFSRTCPDALLQPGLTGTNVMDLQLVLIFD